VTRALALAATAAVAASVAAPHAGACGRYRTDTTVRIAGASLKAEVAATQASRERGLGGRACIPADRAMLFDFGQPGFYAFWMKGMRFPIDIVWVGTNHRVVTAVRNLAPASFPKEFVNHGGQARWVLELKANTVRRLHVRRGTPVVIGGS
jgi:uncharacterized membrane protein (UPF0127 family)